jgi:putative oxidoreductase
MINDRMAPVGALVLRAALGVINLARSLMLKYLEFALPGTAEYLRTIGFAGCMAYATLAAERVGGVLLLVGVWSRAVALVLIPVLVGAFTAHAGNRWAFSNPNGGYPVFLPVFLIVGSVVVALVGDRAYAFRSTPALSRSRPARLRVGG